MTLIVTSVILNAIAQLFMKMASSRELTLKASLTNVPLWVAGGLYLISILFWLKGLSGVPLSKAYPYQSLGYVLVFSASFALFGEKIAPVQILGLLIICTGIVILGFSN
jgi:multidrug transporter EmrE-like cation transporter